MKFLRVYISDRAWAYLEKECPSALDELRETVNIQIKNMEKYVPKAGAILYRGTEEPELANIRSMGLPIPMAQIDTGEDIHALLEALFAQGRAYEESMMAPFFKELTSYVENKPYSFATPGHDSGAFYEKHPAGYMLVSWFGRNLFASDVSSSDVSLGDPVIHDGPAYTAEKEAARIFNADFTYFVLNGTSGSNKTVCAALLAPGDVVLFDRNNHRSLYQGALSMMGADAVFLEAERNAKGMIGGIPDAICDETVIRERLAEVRPDKAQEKRPFRLAVLQHNTHDGLIYNVKEVIKRIGHLCDYILFDAAWLGYEQCLPMLKDCSPLQLELGPEDPGILVTQSVHKQLAGFSQTSQIHKKDRHIKGQKRYCNHDAFNNAFILMSSTSPCYPMFSSVAVNAKMHDGPYAKKLWADTVKTIVSLRKEVMTNCRYIQPFQDTLFRGKPWQEITEEEGATTMDAYHVRKEWTGFSDCSDALYALDPCKFTIMLPGISLDSWEWEDIGIPANILASYLEEKGFICEKSDMYAMLFLFTPSVTKEKVQALAQVFMQFEADYDANTPLTEAIPSLAAAYPSSYAHMGLRDICDKMHAFYREHEVTRLLQRLFEKEYFPEVVMNAQEANYAFNRHDYVKVPVEDCLGKVAVEGALPYPPGIILVNGGERWTQEAIDYFMFLDTMCNEFPGFDSEIQGVHPEYMDGKRRTYAYVYEK